jgi:hypothetical protein
VHGSQPPEVSEEDVRLFAADVREALDEYLRYGQEQGFTCQSLLVAALDGHPGLVAGQGLAFALAGWAAQATTPATVTTIAGLAGALLACSLTITWRRLPPPD